MPYTLLDDSDQAQPKQKGYVLLDDAPKEKVFGEDSSLVGFGMGADSGVGKVMFNAQKYLGKGINALTDMWSPYAKPEEQGNSVGNFLISDADKRLQETQSRVLPYKKSSPIATGAGELGGEIAATLPVGGALGQVAKFGARAIPSAAPVLTPLAESLATGGMRAAGTQGALQNIVTRAAGGSATGGISSELANPGSGSTGAAIGAALPVAVQAAGKAGTLVGDYAKKLVSKGVSEDVASLAQRAKDLGIDIPADRIVNSRPLNAVAAGLNYVPLSGRAGTEELMNSQLNTALSRTFGQDSSNVTMALRKANDQLGAKFDHVLQNNGVKVDDQFLNGLAQVADTAEKELGSDALKPITSQINEIFNKAQDGVIDGQAAYNIKRTLDRLSRQNTPTAYHALQLKSELMDALNRSLGPEQASAFAKTRQQYGNMLALEKLATNGVEGEISAARLANMKNINNPELQELADISAQFVRGREGQHGAAQRALVGITAGALGGVPGAAAGSAAGRITNAVLNSNRLKSMMLGQPVEQSTAGKILGNQDLQRLILQGAPVAASQ